MGASVLARAESHHEPRGDSRPRLSGEQARPSWYEMFTASTTVAELRSAGSLLRTVVFDGNGTSEDARAPSKFALLFTVLLALAGCRQDMHDQPRFKPFARSDFYTDLRSARPPVEGTVARGQLREDTYLYTGKIGSNPGDYMPFPVTAEVLARGHNATTFTARPVIPAWATATVWFPRVGSPASRPLITSSACARRRWDTSST